MGKTFLISFKKKLMLNKFTSNYAKVNIVLINYFKGIKIKLFIFRLIKIVCFFLDDKEEFRVFNLNKKWNYEI